MTPAEQYAQKRKAAVALIQQYAPTRLQTPLSELLRPAIAFKATRADDNQIPLGASKFGGAPDVPEGFEWPMWKGKPLGFLSQINLEQVAPFDVEKLLPESGVLAFFVHLDEENPVCGQVEEREGWQVRYFISEDLKRVEPPSDSHWVVPISPQRVVPLPIWTLPFEFDVPNEEWTEAEWQDFEKGFLDTMGHQLFGGPRAPQLDPLIFAANARMGSSDLYWGSDEAIVASKDWHLLLQLDTALSGFFNDIDDVGWLYFMIHKDDLATRDFSNVWFNEQCT